MENAIVLCERAFEACGVLSTSNTELYSISVVVFFQWRNIFQEAVRHGSSRAARSRDVG